MSNTPEIEKVARAIYEDEFPPTDEPGLVDLDAWENISDLARGDYIGKARAALLAIREPTERMIEEMESKHLLLWDDLGEECAKTFTRAIDAALGEENTP